MISIMISLLLSNFPARRAMMMEQQPYEEGSILENTPKNGSMAKLIELAEDREKWRLEVNSLKLGSIAITPKHCSTVTFGQ